jgi:acetolactate synthase-1/2/3 large subunit
MARSGTPRMFGLAGAADSPLLVAARERGLAVVQAHTVTAACAMAAVTADLTDAPGIVVLDTPAVPVAVSGLGRCTVDGSPVILVTPPSQPSAREAAALAAITKAVIPLAPELAGRWIAHAVHLAFSVPRGPVAIELSPAVATASAIPITTALRPAALPPPEPSVLDEAAHVLSSAARPVVLVGMLARSADAAGWLRAFAEATPAPVLSSPRAKGVLPDPHPLALGLCGRGPVARAVLARADLVVAVGLDPIEAAQTVWDPRKAVLHVGPSAAGDAPYRALADVIGDIGLIFAELAPRLRDRPRADWDVAELDRLKRLLVGSEGHGELPERFVRLARDATPPGTIAVADGTVRDACARAWHAVAPGEFLAPNDSSVTGFGIPAALAALLIHPERHVVCFTDTAGFTETVAELDIASGLELPAIVVVWTDDAAGVEAGARALGIASVAARDEAAFGWAIERALAAKGPTVISVPATSGSVTTPV